MPALSIQSTVKIADGPKVPKGPTVSEVIGIPGTDTGGSTPPVTTKPDLTTWDFYAQFDEGSGTTAANSGTVGAAANGTLVAHSGGALPTWGTENGLDHLSFNGGKVQCGTSVRPTSAFTALAMVKPRSLGGSGLYPGLVSNFEVINTNDRNGFDLVLQYSTQGVWGYAANGAQISATAIAPLSGLPQLVVDEWFLFGVAYNGSVLELTLNGAQIAQTTSGLPASIGYFSGTQLTIGFGSDQNVGLNYGLDGLIEWAAVDNTYKTPADILAIWDSTGH